MATVTVRTSAAPGDTVRAVAKSEEFSPNAAIITTAVADSQSRAALTVADEADYWAAWQVGGVWRSVAFTTRTSGVVAGAAGPHHASHEPGGGDPMAVDAAAGVGSLRTLGSGAQQAMPGNTALGGNPPDYVTLYVHPAGSNGANGRSWERAMQTPQAAYDALPSTGGTLVVAPGVYDVGAGLILNKAKPVVITSPTGTRPFRTEYYGDTSWPGNVVFKTTNAGATRLVEIGVQPTSAQIGAGCEFHGITFDMRTGAALVHAIWAEGVINGVLEDCGCVDSPPSVERYMLRGLSSVANGGDFSWWRIRNNHTNRIGLCDLGLFESPYYNNCNNNHIRDNVVFPGPLAHAVKAVGMIRSTIADNNFEPGPSSPSPIYLDHCYGNTIIAADGEGSSATGVPYLEAIACSGNHFEVPGITSNVTDYFETQTVTITGAPTGGTFKLGYEGLATAAIAYNASVATVQSALNALPSVGVRTVVTGSTGGPWTITFNSAGPESLFVLDTNSLTGGASPSVAIARTVLGALQTAIKDLGQNILDAPAVEGSGSYSGPAAKRIDRESSKPSPLRTNQGYGFPALARIPMPITFDAQMLGPELYPVARNDKLTAEYWDGSAWQAWSPTNLAALTWKNTDDVTVDVTHRKFRLTIDDMSAVDSPILYLLFDAPSSVPGNGDYTVRVEGLDASNVVVQHGTLCTLKIDLNSEGLVYPGPNLAASTKLRVTFDFTNALPSGTMKLSFLQVYTRDAFSEKLYSSIEYSGAGSPEGVVRAKIGCRYWRTDGGSGTTLYVKETGTGTTGWVPYGPPPAGGAPTVVRRSTDAAAISLNTTLAADSQLLFPVLANEVWFFQAFLLISAGNATMDAKFGWTVPAAAVMTWGAGGVAGSTAQPGYSAMPAGSSGAVMLDQTGNIQIGTTAGMIGVHLAGVVVVGANAGNVNLTVAQNTSDALNLIVKANSLLIATKLA